VRADGGAPRFDPAEWELKRTAAANFGPQLPQATVSLFKSRKQYGEDGSGEPLYAANLVVSAGDKVLYEFAKASGRKPEVLPERRTRVKAPGQTPRPLFFKADPDVYYMDDVLALVDVTGDGVPEIVFRTGWSAADNYSEEIHFLQLVGTQANPGFRDIQLPGFVEDQWQRVAWLTYAGHPLVIVAEQQEPEFKSLEEWCYQCGRYHRYRVYEWDRAERRMVLRATIPNTHTVHDVEDPFQEERSYILAHLRRVFGLPGAKNPSNPAGRWPVRTHFDLSEWDAVATVTADFGPTFPRASVRLLTSKEVVSREEYSDGRGIAENRMANVVVERDGQLIYQYCWLATAYHHGRPIEEFFKDSMLELRDVTNDGIPEILFHTVSHGASWPAVSHVLHYDPRRATDEAFRDVFLPEWEPHDPDNVKFAWLEIGGRTLGVLAVPEDTTPSQWGHRYEWFEWNQGRQAFERRGSIRSTGQTHEADADPFAVDAGYLREQLTRRASPTAR